LEIGIHNLNNIEILRNVTNIRIKAKEGKNVTTNNSNFYKFLGQSFLIIYRELSFIF